MVEEVGAPAQEGAARFPEQEGGRRGLLADRAGLLGEERGGGLPLRDERPLPGELLRAPGVRSCAARGISQSSAYIEEEAQSKETIAENSNAEGDWGNPGKQHASGDYED